MIPGARKLIAGDFNSCGPADMFVDCVTGVMGVTGVTEGVTFFS